MSQSHGKGVAINEALMRCYGINEILRIYSASAVCRLLPVIYPSHSRGDSAVHKRKQSILLVLFTTDLCGLSVTLFKLEGHGSLNMPESNPGSGLGRLFFFFSKSIYVRLGVQNPT